MIAIVGAGAIGRLWAASLPPDQTCFLDTRVEATETPASSYSTSRLSYNILNSAQKHIAKATVQILPLSPCNSLEFDAVLICTKAYSALDVAIVLDKNIGKQTPLFLFQNGMGSQVSICAHVKGRPIYAASTTDGANLRKDGSLVMAGAGTTHIGPLQDVNMEEGTALRALDAINLSDRNIKLDSQILKTLWRKLMINCAINPITAIENCRNGDMVDTPTFKKYWTELRRELSLLTSIGGLDMDETEIEQTVLDVASTTQDNISSMLQDIRAGKQTEIEQINGFAARTLDDAGLPADANKQLRDRVNALGN